MANMGLVEKWFVNHLPQYLLHKLFGALKLLNRIHPTPPPQKILEIGCGVGMTSKFIARKFQEAQITATDFDPEQIEKAKETRSIPSVQFQQADATRLPFADHTFDASFSFLVLHHIPNFPDAIKELYRVLKSGGRLYILDLPAKSWNPLWRWFRLGTPGVFSKGEILQLLRQCGFSIENYSGNLLFNLQARK